MRLVSTSLAIALFTGAVASCSSSSGGKSAPVIDELDAPASVSLNATSGSSGYDIPCTFKFHDDSEAATSYLVHLDVPAAVVPDQHHDIDPSAAQQSFDVTLDAATKKGTVTVVLTVYGASGVASDAATKSVTLQ